MIPDSAFICLSIKGAIYVMLITDIEFDSDDVKYLLKKVTPVHNVPCLDFYVFNLYCLLI